jgi:hypothetical protein
VDCCFAIVAVRPTPSSLLSLANSPSYAMDHHDPFDHSDPIGTHYVAQRKLLAFRIVNERGDLHHREAIIP